MSIWGTDFVSFLHNLLNKAGLDNTYGYILFAIIVMGVVSGFLAFLKADALILLLVNIVLVVLFAGIGFFADWVFILIVIILGFFLFVSFGGGKD